MHGNSNIKNTHTLGRTPLDEGSVRRRDLYLTTHNIHKRHPLPPAGFEPAIPASERRQTHGATTGIGLDCLCNKQAVLGSIAVRQYDLRNKT